MTDANTVVGFLKFAISVRRRHCDYWLRGAGNLTTPLIMKANLSCNPWLAETKERKVEEMRDERVSAAKFGASG